MQTNNTSNQDKPDDFKEGDTVWCLMRGKGKVVMVLTARYFQHRPILVDFPKTVNPVTGEEYSNRHSYSKDGKWSQDFNRTLFFSEPKIEASVNRPFVPTLVGKTVMVQYYDETWTVKPITITEETFEEVFTKDGSDFKSDLLAIYEVSSENLLKP